MLACVCMYFLPSEAEEYIHIKIPAYFLPLGLHSYNKIPAYVRSEGCILTTKFLHMYSLTPEPQLRNCCIWTFWAYKITKQKISSSSFASPSKNDDEDVDNDDHESITRHTLLLPAEDTMNGAKSGTRAQFSKYTSHVSTLQFGTWIQLIPAIWSTAINIM